MVFLRGSNKAVETPKVKPKSEFEFYYEIFTKRVDDFIIFRLFSAYLITFLETSKFSHFVCFCKQREN